MHAFRAARDAIAAKKKAIVKRVWFAECTKIGTHEFSLDSGKRQAQGNTNNTCAQSEEAGRTPINNFITISDTGQLPSVLALGKPYAVIPLPGLQRSNLLPFS